MLYYRLSFLGLNYKKLTRKIQDFAAAEARRCFGSTVFDEVFVDYTTDFKTIAIMQQLTPKLNFLFRGFSEKKYNSSRTYRHQIRGLCHVLKGANALYIPEEMKKLRIMRSLKNITMPLPLS